MKALSRPLQTVLRGNPVPGLRCNDKLEGALLGGHASNVLSTSSTLSNDAKDSRAARTISGPGSIATIGRPRIAKLFVAWPVPHPTFENGIVWFQAGV